MQLVKRDYWALGISIVSLIFFLCFYQYILNSSGEPFAIGIIFGLTSSGIGVVYFIGAGTSKNSLIRAFLLTLGLSVVIGFFAGIIWGIVTFAYFILTSLLVKNPVYKMFLFVLGAAILIYKFLNF